MSGFVRRLACGSVYTYTGHMTNSTAHNLQITYTVQDKAPFGYLIECSECGGLPGFHAFESHEATKAHAVALHAPYGEFTPASLAKPTIDV